MDKHKGKRSQWKSFFHLLRMVKMPYGWILLGILGSVAAAEMDVLFPSYSQQIMAGNISNEIITATLLVLVGSSIAMALSNGVQRLGAARVSAAFRRTIWKKMTRLPMSFYDKNGSRTLISRVTSDTAVFGDYCISLLPSLVALVYSTVRVIMMLSAYDWRLVAAEVAMIPLYLVVLIFQAKATFKLNKNVRTRTAQLTGKISELLLNIPLYKAFAQEKKARAEGDAYAHKLYRTQFGMICVGSGFSAATSLLNVARAVVVILLGVYLTGRHIITIDIWIAYWMYSGRLVGSVTKLMNMWIRTKEVMGSTDRISEIAWEAEEDYASGAACRGSGDIVFDNITFGYGDDPVLSGISFTAKEGQRTAIVGPSGAGKSTLLSLLERLYPPRSGSISIDGQDITAFNLNAWRKQIGYVPQNPFLMDGSIRENLLYGVDRPVTEEELVSAARAANALDFIQEMEQGFDSSVGELGSKLSGGQKQRIAIARMMLCDPKIILMDEVTASLDLKTEAAVTSALRKLCEGRTTIIVAHKLSEICDADKIVVIGNKQVAESGTHKELMAQKGLYSQLYTMQMQEAVAAGGAV